MRRSLEQMVTYALETQRGGVPLANDPLVRDKIAELAIEVEIARCLTYHHAWLRDKGIIPNYEASVIKLFGGGLGQRISKCFMELAGLYGQLQEGSKWAPLDGRIEHGACLSPYGSIVGGTSEVMRTVIALRGLGLPGLA
jgi:alkylation response protein AidB-like acyl-CoA dehydrogenase